MNQAAWIVGCLAILGGLYVGIRRRNKSSQAGGKAELTERRSQADEKALAARQIPQDKISLNLDRLRSQDPAYEPLVEYLSYIQVQRGEKKSLIFVRRRDLDTLASLTGLSKEAFVEEFQQMGVLLSMN